jgi:hypothetical protein
VLGGKFGRQRVRLTGVMFEAGTASPVFYNSCLSWRVRLLAPVCFLIVELGHMLGWEKSRQLRMTVAPAGVVTFLKASS